MLWGCVKVERGHEATCEYICTRMIIGGALLMNVQTAFTIHGYPDLAMVRFFISALLGFVFITKRWRGDPRARRQQHRNH